MSEHVVHGPLLYTVINIVKKELIKMFRQFQNNEPTAAMIILTTMQLIVSNTAIMHPYYS